MKTIKKVFLSSVLMLPIILTGCQSMFVEGYPPNHYYTTDSYYHYYDANYNDDAISNNGNGSRSYGRGSGSSKPRSNRPSTSSTAESIESAGVPVEPPSLD